MYMNESEVIEYFDSIKIFATITVFTCEADDDCPEMIFFGFDIKDIKSNLISGASYPFKTRKEATIKCAEKLIELHSRYNDAMRETIILKATT